MAVRLCDSVSKAYTCFILMLILEQISVQLKYEEQANTLATIPDAEMPLSAGHGLWHCHVHGLFLIVFFS